MKTLLQRVSCASVTVEGQVVGEIGPGILVLLGIEKTDTQIQLEYHVKKLLSLRIFPDDAGKINRSVVDVKGDLLIVSQFMLAADCTSGNRPDFDNAMPPTEARAMYEAYIARIREQASGVSVATGQFGAMMAVSLINDGPVTFWLE